MSTVKHSVKVCDCCNDCNYEVCGENVCPSVSDWLDQARKQGRWDNFPKQS